ETAPVPDAKPAAVQEAKPATPSEPAPATVEETTPSPAPDTTPAAVVDLNAPIAEQLRNLANGKFDRIIGNKKERAAIEAFYAGRNYATVWITDGNSNERAAAAIAYLKEVGA